MAEKPNRGAGTGGGDLVSVVLPTYNRGYILEKAVKSVLQQTYRTWELLVVDDGSKDDTPEIMARYRDPRIKYIRLRENRGANYCRNTGVRNAAGDYIAFLDSDNYWRADKLEMQMREICNTDEDAAFVFCREKVINGSREYVAPDWDPAQTGLAEALYERNVVDTSTVLMKRQWFEKAGGFDEQMPRIQDWEFFFRVVHVYGCHAVFMDVCLNENVIQDNSITRDSRKYVDAIFYFMQKYPAFFEDTAWLERHVRNTFVSNSNGQEQYICEKIRADSRRYQPAMPQVLADLAVQLNRQRRFYNLLYQWKLAEARKGGAAVFACLSVKEGMTVAVYGLGQWGELFYQECKKLPVWVMYGIDKKVRKFHSLQVKKPTDKLEPVDVIVVTIFQEFEEIRAELAGQQAGEVVSLEELIQSGK